MKRGFTLIELLVVIAIIAILAAILFPVFAQAKEAAKKTSDISQQKQLGTSMFIYVTDTDDLFPLQAGQDSAGVWGYNFNKFVPSDWPTDQTLQRVAFSQSFALNAAQPYIKNDGILANPGASGSEYQAATAVAPGKKKYRTNYAYNGFLSGYSVSAVAENTKLPLFTNQNGNKAGLGWGFANPALTCATPNQACTFVPSVKDANGNVTACSTGNGSTGAVYLTYDGGSQWTYSKGQNWTFADSHAKFRPLGRAVNPDYKTDPNAGYNTNTGTAGSYYWDGCHAWLFRPDYEFNK